jgi:rhodanese-related sulfurtransferase/uncharacterized membrane protein YedE/YeeE
MAPFDPVEAFGKPIGYLIFVLFGMGFGASLEIAGFGLAHKLVGQFYFKDQTVYKTMFTSVLVAMVLIFLTAGLGLLDYARIFVPPTYMWPGILGGLLLGFGIIIGGYCPGTSLVSSSSGHLDGIFFVVGVMTGGLLFGGVVDDLFWDFFNSSYYGRFTLPEWLGVPTGVVVFVVVVVGVITLWGSDAIEKRWKRKEGTLTDKEVKKDRRILGVVSVVLIIGALAVMLIGQPSLADAWNKNAEKQALLQEGKAFVPAEEMNQAIYDPLINPILLDVRDERDYNLYHLEGARNVTLEEIPGMIEDLVNEPEGTVVFVMSNDETRAVEAWKLLVAKNSINAYVLKGGINGWIEEFAEDKFVPLAEHPDDALGWIIPEARGEKWTSAIPEQPHETKPYEIIKLQKKAPTGAGGCG